MGNGIWVVLLLATCLAAGCLADELAPTASERGWMRGWYEAAFRGLAAEPAPAPIGIEVRRQDYSTLHRRQSVMNTPLCIGTKPFDRGLGTHSVSELAVRLPSAAKRFTAQVGIDNNYDTAGTRGSVTFAVDAGGRELWHSDLCRGGGEPVAVAVDLTGAREFTLRVGDGGDGPGWDQSDWCDAQVELADGRLLWLDDLPIVQAPPTFAVAPPCSLSLDGQPAVVREWTRTVAEPAPGRLQVTWRDAGSHLAIECSALWHEATAAVEWQTTLRNEGNADSPLIELPRSLDLALGLPAANDVWLHRSNGSTCTETDFLPVDTELKPATDVVVAPGGGRSSNGALPFFNLSWPGGGLIGAVGWSGQWELKVARDDGRGLRMSLGQQTSRYRLHAGESVRLPSVLLAGWQGDDPQRGHNRLRRTMLSAIVPRDREGKPALPPLSENTWFAFNQGNEVTEANQLAAIDAMAQVGVEGFWLDAGWFVGGWPTGVGSWTPKPDAFPRGLKPLGDAARANRMGFVLWFEPERVHSQSAIGREHPEFVLRAGGGDGLYNLGDPAARAWLRDHLNRCIADWGITVYRNDFNIDPLGFWQAADKPERQGITEIRYIEGLYTLWDELRAAHPGLQIDNCASGGRRIDLETCRRSYPLWRSDTQCGGKAMPAWDQAQTAGLSRWVPLHAAGVWGWDAYTWRSVATTGASVCRPPLAAELPLVQRRIGETKALRPLWLGDHYNLLPVNVEPDKWCAWQLDRPDLGEGAVFCFRRAASPHPSVEVALHSLDPAATYELSYVDTGRRQEASGEALARLVLDVPDKPGMALVTYRRKAPANPEK